LAASSISFEKSSRNARERGLDTLEADPGQLNGGARELAADLGSGSRQRSKLADGRACVARRIAEPGGECLKVARRPFQVQLLDESLTEGDLGLLDGVAQLLEGRARRLTLAGGHAEEPATLRGHALEGAFHVAEPNSPLFN
jgi:hypothetical protein